MSFYTDFPVYPTEILNTTDYPDQTDDVDFVLADLVNALRDEMIAVQTELGTLPKGAYADVKARIAAAETPSIIQDADSDTYVKVEQDPDDDLIRFSVEGAERAVMGDGTNEELFILTNAGTHQALKIVQNGVLAAGKRALHVYSNAAQTGSEIFIYFQQDNAASTADVLYISNDGIGHTLRCDVNGVSQSGYAAIFIYTAAAQTAEPLCYIWSDHSSSNMQVLALRNDGTGQAQYINQTGNGVCLEINNDGTNKGIYLHQDGALASSQYGVHIYSNAAHSRSSAPGLLYIENDNAASDFVAAYIRDDGVGGSLWIYHDGAVLKSGTPAVVIYSNQANVNSNTPLLWIAQDNAAATQPCIFITQDGLGNSIRIDDNNAGGSSLYITKDCDTSGLNNAIMIEFNNAGSGGLRGIYFDLNCVGGDEWAFEFAGAEAVAAAVGGNQDKKIRIRIAGATYYIPCYDA